MLLKIFSLLSFCPLFAAELPTIAVVGAGLAGLTAAYRLQQSGLPVTVYEARNRVGGRVFSAKADNQIVELGGQNIRDGGEAENILRLIDEFNLEITKYRHPLAYDYFDGDQFIPNTYSHVEMADLQNLAQSAKTMQGVFDQILQSDPIRYKSLAVRLAAYEGATIDQLSSHYIETLYHMLNGGISHAHQAEKEPAVDVISIKGGNSRLAETLAQQLPVHLNRQLTSITKDKQYTLTFQNGQTVCADILILTIPCPVYKNIHFENVIPQDTLRAIQNVQYGTNAKIIVPILEMPSKVAPIINNRMVCWLNLQSQSATVYYAGESARFCPDSIINCFEEERPVLEKRFTKIPSSITYAEDVPLPSSEGAIGFSWPNDPYAQGSYSYIAPGQEALLTQTHIELNETVKTLFAPLNQTLYFAGEHTSTIPESGTMEAACESGEKAARMILHSISQ